MGFIKTTIKVLQKNEITNGFSIQHCLVFEVIDNNLDMKYIGRKFITSVDNIIGGLINVGDEFIINKDAKQIFVDIKNKIDPFKFKIKVVLE